MRREGQTSTIVSRSVVPNDDAFMLYGMFAIGARFSTSPYFQSMDPVDRGEVYANRAAVLKDTIIKKIQQPTLEFLKGCVILAFYCFTAGQIGPGSVLTSVCIRFAYDLSLDEIDEDQMNDDGSLNKEIFDRSVDSWVRKEELRRLWWSIWELDTFAATLSCQPYGIERGEMKVLLPVPNDNWFSGLPMRSAFINHRPETVWKSLQGSPNQSARSWFLLANYLMSCIAFAGRQSSRSSTSTKPGLETAVCNFKLSLPVKFQLRSLFLDKNNFEEGNWIISTHLMIIG